MPRAERGGCAVKAPISAEARRWWPAPSVRELGGRKEELLASGVLFLLPIMLLADMIAAERWQHVRGSDSRACD